MAHHLAKIHGTEEDKVNCPFYYKIGACRHGDRCSRIHHKPAFSPTLLIKHLYVNPKQQQQQNVPGMPDNSNSTSPDQALEDYLCFYEDLYLEFSKVGPVLEMHVVDNLSDHMVGNVYVKMADEESAADALSVMAGRYYDGRIIQAEYSPVTDFREARCRAHEEGECDRGSMSCNFLHIKPIPELLVRSLEDEAEHERREEKRRRHGSSHHPKKEKKRKREPKSSSSRDRDRDRDRSSSSKRHRSSSRRDDRRGRRDDDGDDHNDDDDGRSSDGSSGSRSD
jgi:splicing factor U2AF 35 kDa subunit